MRITVVGDVLLDEDIDGSIEKFAPDAPVPVVQATSRTFRAGGAGLVAAMLKRDGHTVELVTVLSEDERAAKLRACLEGITVVAGASAASTPTKTRVRSAGHSVCRVDEGCEKPPVPAANNRMLEVVQNADAIIVSDYGRRLTENLALREKLNERGAEVPLVWDPHPLGADPVSNTWCVTPNFAEARHRVGDESDALSPRALAEALRSQYACHAVLVTLGEEGAVLSARGRDGTVFIPTVRVAHADPCGAGDRLAATTIACIGEGLALEDSVRVAVDAAREYLAAGGVASLYEAPETGEMLKSEQNVFSRAQRMRDRGGVVVATGGCFDLLHAGHVRTLEAARELGDFLIVCLNSDESVRRMKGEGRPIMAEQDRVEMLLALACVDGVVVFGEDDPIAVLEQLKPQIWVKGGDYVAADLPEAEVLKAWGGAAVTLPYYLGRSTSYLVDAIARVG